MKHKAAQLLSLALILCLAVPSTAYAANETGATTTVTYTKADPDAGADAPSADYEISIPASVSLNTGRELNITSSSMNLSEGQSVVVSLDYEKTMSAGDGYLYLQDASTGKAAKVVINRHNYDTGSGELLYSTDSTVAVFTGTNLQPSKYGLLYLNLSMPGNIEPGTYTGTIYFNIALIYG